MTVWSDLVQDQDDCLCTFPDHATEDGGQSCLLHQELRDNGRGAVHHEGEQEVNPMSDVLLARVSQLS